MGHTPGGRRFCQDIGDACGGAAVAEERHEPGAGDDRSSSETPSTPDGRDAGRAFLPDEDEIIAAASAARERMRRRRSRMALAVSIAVTVGWVVYVTLAGQWVRVGNNWQAALTMVFGSFVAGSTPQGGGAIAFPVFTKALEVPTEVARTFSLSIQMIGMGTAATAIIFTRRMVEWRAVAVGGAAALVSFLGALFLVGDPGRPFWPSVLPDDYVRVTFTLVLASMAVVVYLGTRVRIRKVDTAMPAMNARLYTALVVAGLLGGLATALTGSGADVMMYLFVVVLFGVDPRVGVPSSVLVMAVLSVVGFLLLGLGDGQLSVQLDQGETGVVTAVGGHAVSGETVDGSLTAVYGDDGTELPAGQFDLFGMWIAAFPVVAWGAPLGSWIASRITARRLIYFVLSLSLLETVSTVIFLDELHRPTWLLAYAVAGLAVLVVGLYLLAKYRRIIFALPAISPEQTLRRGDLEVAPGYERQLDDAD